MQRRPASYPMESKPPRARVAWDPGLRALAAALLFGAATPASKLLLKNLDPLALAGWLYIGAAVGVLPAVLRNGLRAPTDAGDRRLLLGAILFGGVLGPVALLLGLRLAAAASVSLWLNLELVATALLGVFFFREHLSRKGWVAVAGVLAAGILLTAGEGRSGVLAAMLVATACLFWGIDNQLTSLIAGIGPAQTTFWKGLVAGSFNLTAAAVLGVKTIWWGAVPPAILVGIFAYGISIALYIGAARELGAIRSQLLFASAPFFGLFFSWIALGESLSGRHGAAAVLFGASVSVLLRDRHAHEHAHTHEARTHAHAHRHDDGHHTHTHPELPPETRHTHVHSHEETTHRHPHWPDLHHRHDHDSGKGEGNTAEGDSGTG